jgi:hypothetical protein
MQPSDSPTATRTSTSAPPVRRPGFGGSTAQVKGLPLVAVLHRTGPTTTFVRSSTATVKRVPISGALLPGGGELDRYADEGVRVFLAAYGVRPRRRG